MDNIYVCSPYSSDPEYNVKLACAICRKIVMDYGMNPIAPHIYYTQFLNDEIEHERSVGMKMAIYLLGKADQMWVFGPPSEGMKSEIQYTTRHLDIPIVYNPFTISLKGD